jgi:3-deoxy-7-phosphoheptulonate synthase
VILRGGAAGSNYDPESLAEVGNALENAGLPNRVMIDCSHGNSDKDFTRQPEVAAELAGQIAAGDRSIIGLMMESFLEDGRQDYRKGVDLVYGQSVTDACMGWERTQPLFGMLAEAVRSRRDR